MQIWGRISKKQGRFCTLPSIARDNGGPLAGWLSRVSAAGYSERGAVLGKLIPALSHQPLQLLVLHLSMTILGSNGFIVVDVKPRHFSLMVERHGSYPYVEYWD
jgi:hypothetical protein